MTAYLEDVDKLKRIVQEGISNLFEVDTLKEGPTRYCKGCSRRTRH